MEKQEDARVVLVVGDFMAGSLADGLENAFAEDGDIRVIEETSGSSGLVRQDYYNWQSELPAIMETHSPDVVVIMIGSNDRQELIADGGAAAVGSDQWNAAYRGRVEALAKTVTERGVPLVWIGAPAYRYSSMSADMLAFNQIYMDVVEGVDGVFVDIWDGFVDEEGKFVYTGSDVRGQQARLRGSDGINMTAAGREKLAFYVERPLRRLLGDGDSDGPRSAPLGDDGLAPLDAEEPKLIVRTPPMRFTDPSFDGGEALLAAARRGDEPERENDEPERGEAELRSPREILVEDGEFAAAPTGRADDYRWPPSARIEREPADSVQPAARTSSPAEAAPAMRDRMTPATDGDGRDAAALRLNRAMSAN